MISKNIFDTFGSKQSHVSFMGTKPLQREQLENVLHASRTAIFGIFDKPYSGRPSVFNEDRLEALILEDPRQTSRESVGKMHC